MHVGVFPLNFVEPIAYLSLPHARGGVSLPHNRNQTSIESSPCTWGCFSSSDLRMIDGQVFPMHVGVFPPHSDPCRHLRSLPHARGGVSYMQGNLHCGRKSSPCTWGCFLKIFFPRKSDEVFPMHVGVFPVVGDVGISCVCLPHARGGVSTSIGLGVPNLLSSPCTWGCFLSVY